MAAVEGTEFVGRVPSELEIWFIRYAETHEIGFIYTHEGNPGIVDLGLVMRVQRKGDLVMTRPLFMIREWAEGLWDHVPETEWSTL